VVFVHVDDAEAVVDIPQRHREIQEIAYLGGRTLGDLIGNERVATAEALRAAGRPNATIHLPRIGPNELGQLLMLLEIATVYAGALYDVNPLDQPGVDAGKRIIYGLMGRAGTERPQIPDPDPHRVV